MADENLLRIALIGAGTFARKAHIPSLLALSGRFRVVAVCSRSRGSAQQVAEMLPQPVALYDKIPALLAREDLDAVDIILPIPTMPEVVAQCLAAGKHVISEKPIAPSVAQANEVLQISERHPSQIWMVAENWRYEEAYQAAGQAVQNGAIGRPLLCDWALQLPVMPDTPYHRTRWRRTNQFPGGFLLDGGVHHVAALRTVLGEIEAVSAISTGHRNDLPPADTLAASFAFANGAVGSYSVTYAAPSGVGIASLHVVGSAGSLRVQPARLSIWRAREAGAPEAEEQRFAIHRSVERELAAFADAVQQGASHRNRPREALQDLAVVETILAAADTGISQPVPRYI